MAAYILWSFHVYFMQMRQADLKNWSTAVGESILDELEQQDLQGVEELVKRYGAPATITVRVFDPKGQLLATSSPEDVQIQNWLQIPGVRASLQKKSVQAIGKGVLSNDDRLYISRPLLRNQQLLGALRMSITLQQYQRQFARVIYTVLGTLIVTVFLCSLISEWLARNLSRPIQLMQQFAIRLGGGHFGDKLMIRQNNELDQLALELNRMSERLASLDRERRTFLANVSHELRTPISNVQVTVEALQNGANEDITVRDRFLQNVQDETKRLSRLIDDLLDLGRLEAGVTPLEKQTVRLPNLIYRALRAVESRLQARGISVEMDVAEIQVEGDSERLLQAILNILDNAIKHSHPGGQIEVWGRKEGKQAAITIKDWGEGVNSGDLSRIFEQFYTGDRSRKGNSTGLGLAIAKRIIEAHGGQIIATSQSGQGATFTLYLPLTL